MPKVLAPAAIWAGLLGISYVVSYYLNVVVEFRAAAILFGSYQLVFLPHGIKLILTWMYGWMSVLIILPVTAVAAAFLLPQDSTSMAKIALVLLKVVSMPIAFDMFRLAGLDLRGRAEYALNWRVLFLVAFLSAIINSLGRHALGCCRELSASAIVPSVLGSMIGDMLGAAVVLLAGMMFFRFLRLKAKLAV